MRESENEGFGVLDRVFGQDGGPQALMFRWKTRNK